MKIENWLLILEPLEKEMVHAYLGCLGWLSLMKLKNEIYSEHVAGY